MAAGSKVALVIGGSGGIGSAVCAKLAADGFDVAVSYNANAAAAERVAEAVRNAGRRAEAVAVDVTDPAGVKAFVDGAATRLGPPDAVVYAGGPFVHAKLIAELTPDEWSHAVDVDVKGCFHLIWAALPHLKARRAGAIVAIITTAVDKAPTRDTLSASPKAAVETLLRGVAKEEGRNGIRANCVGPGWVDAGMGRQVMQTELSAENVERIKRSVPLRRFGTAEEIAEAVAFLLSEKAAYITGQTILVDGGMSL
jgi:NAD(P)-dependent dehydrogenase (short-subunit alcohol dehydrogenase family)